MVVKNGHDECASNCDSTDGCVAWTLKISESYCWLKSACSDKVRKNGWITGTKACGSGRYEY